MGVRPAVTNSAELVVKAEAGNDVRVGRVGAGQDPNPRVLHRGHDVQFLVKVRFLRGDIGGRAVA
jgi:hypothetical protein